MENLFFDKQFTTQKGAIISENIVQVRQSQLIASIDQFLDKGLDNLIYAIKNQNFLIRIKFMYKFRPNLISL